MDIVIKWLENPINFALMGKEEKTMLLKVLLSKCFQEYVDRR